MAFEDSELSSFSGNETWNKDVCGSTAVAIGLELPPFCVDQASTWWLVVAHFVNAGVCCTAGWRSEASRTHSTLNSVGIRPRYVQMRSKFVSVAQWANADATACCAAAFSGTGSLSGFSRIASMLGNSRNVFRKAENSVAAPAPTAPANSSCSTDRSGVASRMRETNSQERGDGK